MMLYYSVFYHLSSQPAYTIQSLRAGHQFFTTARVLPSWLLLLSDYNFILLLSASRLCLWSMEGRWRPVLWMLREYTWSYLSDCLAYGLLLAPVSMIFRLLSILVLLFGPSGEVQVYRPAVRDVRFWFDTNLALDLSYLWSPHKYRKRRKSTRMPRSFHLKLRIQCRVEWIPIRDPVPAICRPSTWQFLLRSRRIPTHTKQSHKTLQSVRSLADSCLGKAGTDDPVLCDPTLFVLFDKCATDQALCQAVCAELGFPDLESMRFYYTYGMLSTNHLLWAVKPGKHPGHVERVLKRVDPIKQFKARSSLASPHFFELKGESRHMREQHALLQSVQLGRQVCHQLGKPHSNNGQALAYHNCVDGRDLPIVFDSGCSVSISPNKDDFIGLLGKPDCDAIKGVGNNSHPIEGFGLLEWRVYDMHGQEFTITTYAYYVPSADIRLFSPQTYFNEQPDDDDYSEAVINRRNITLRLKKYEGLDFQFPFHPRNNIPYMLPSVRGKATSKRLNLAEESEKKLLNNSDYMSAFFSVADENNQNLTAAQKELQLWHFRLCHAGCDWVQVLMKPRKREIGVPCDPPILQPRHQTAAKCDKPKCCSCLLSRQARRGTNSTITVLDTFRREIKDGDLMPGDKVSGDQYHCAVPGRRHDTFGKESSHEKYTGGTLFVDHASGYIFLRNQVSLRAGETVQTKVLFEQFASSVGVTLKNFRVDNHPFASQEFREDCNNKSQEMDFSGVGAHHQNGVAERSLRTVTTFGRSIMLHAMLHWPAQYSNDLWGLALEHAVYLYNRMPNPHSGFAPLELFTGTKIQSYATIQQARVWGCPVYVLDPKLQDGKKIPKWNPRSRRGQFVGFSPEHASTVGRVLNLSTGKVSPQYHVVYDETFSTVFNVGLDLDRFSQDQWEGLISSGLEKTIEPEDFPSNGKPPFAEWYESFIKSTSSSVERFLPDSEGEGKDDESSSLTPDSDDEETVVREGATRSGRRYARANFSNPTTTNRQKVRSAELEAAYVQGLAWNQSTSESRTAFFRAFQARTDSHKDPVFGTQEEHHPLMLQAKMYDDDNPSFEMCMNGPHKEEWKESMRLEIDTLTSMNVWEEVDRQPWMNVLPGIWAFRQKRLPSGDVKKRKSRFCCGGHKQQFAVDYFRVWSPLVNWTTVRLLLILSVILDLATQQVDYTAAFVHAPIDKPPGYDKFNDLQKSRSGVFVEMPRGFSKPGKVYRLNKSLYGLKQAPRNFFHHLKAQLESIGFESKAEVDPCLFISDKVICLVYCDDTLLYAKSQDDIDDVINKLRDPNGCNMTLEVEDTVSGFLGVLIQRDTKSGTITLVQEGLAKKIVEALDIAHLDPVTTPADGVLTSDPDGDPPDAVFNYKSVCGMMLYLTGHSRPDCSMATSQVCRFTHNTKRSHEEALERIGQYLKGTMGKGLVLRPTLDALDVDAYVDTDFAGLALKEVRSDPTSVKSRTGYVICIANCPVIWRSKLQSQVATSSTHAEYIGLSTAMKEIIPLRELLSTVADAVGLPADCKTTFRTRIWEDNDGCRTIANLEPGRFTPASKWYDITLHWFRQYLTERVTVERIDTARQWADIFTKPLKCDVFVKIRKLVMGW